MLGPGGGLERKVGSAARLRENPFSALTAAPRAKEPDDAEPGLLPGFLHADSVFNDHKCTHGRLSYIARCAMRVALDAMGGDFAPGPIVTGACEAVGDHPELTVVLVGDRERIEAELAKAPDAPRIACRSSTPARPSAWTKSRSTPYERSETTRFPAAGD